MSSVVLERGVRERQVYLLVMTEYKFHQKELPQLGIAEGVYPVLYIGLELAVERYIEGGCPLREDESYNFDKVLL